MSALNYTNAYDTDFHMAEIYDQYETGQADVDLLRRLIGSPGPMKILEPFCGTGRILIPLALDGHTVHGMDQSRGMLDLLRQKIQDVSPEAKKRISLAQVDALHGDWPVGFDLVILGCNCFYELATTDEQEKCIVQAYQSLNPGGHLFLDNDHMEGELAPSWQHAGVVELSLCGKCSDGTVVENTRETIWFDAPHRLARFRRRTRVTLPGGTILEQEFIQQKHPVSELEVRGWLKKNGFVMDGTYGNHDRATYTAESPRAIFWARRS
jgi:SAM-dependent methyltransferase